MADDIATQCEIPGILQGTLNNYDYGVICIPKQQFQRFD
jgi:hypothetical protein